MSEDSPVGSTVTTVQATDMDSAENTVVIHTSGLLPFFYTLEPRQLNANSLQRPLFLVPAEYENVFATPFNRLETDVRG